jgi:hypothetical protein
VSDTLTTPAIKICGLTDVEQALAIAAMDVQAIGVIGVANTARFVESARRREIFSALALHTPTIKRVWVVADPNPSDLEDALAGEGPSHGCSAPWQRNTRTVCSASKMATRHCLVESLEAAGSQGCNDCKALRRLRLMPYFLMLGTPTNSVVRAIAFRWTGFQTKLTTLPGGWLVASVPNGFQNF